MKRIVYIAALTAVLSIGITALAEDNGDFTYPAEYLGGASDTAKVNAAGYSTVLIEKDDENGEIVYVDQADDAYTGAQSFLLKSDPDVGKYKVTLGSEANGAYQTYFYVGVDSSNPADKAMTRLQNEVQNKAETGYNIGYYTELAASEASTYKSLKVGYADNQKYGGFDLSGGAWDTNYSGEGDLYLVFQLNDVPSTWKDSATVFLSTDQVSDTPVQQ